MERYTDIPLIPIVAIRFAPGSLKINPINSNKANELFQLIEFKFELISKITACIYLTDYEKNQAIKIVTNLIEPAWRDGSKQHKYFTKFVENTAINKAPQSGFRTSGSKYSYLTICYMSGELDTGSTYIAIQIPKKDMDTEPTIVLADVDNEPTKVF
jgi:hypothetical protein